jgi:hypothetical protein
VRPSTRCAAFVQQSDGTLKLDSCEAKKLASPAARTRNHPHIVRWVRYVKGQEVKVGPGTKNARNVPLNVAPRVSKVSESIASTSRIEPRNPILLDLLEGIWRRGCYVACTRSSSRVCEWSMEVHANGRDFVVGKHQARKFPHDTSLDNE